MISLRALGVLYAMVRTRSLTSAVKLSEGFLEGEKAIRTALLELESVGYIRRGTYRVNGKIFAYCDVTDAGLEYLGLIPPSAGFDRAVIGGDIQLTEQYSYYSGKTNTSRNIIKSSDGVREGRRRVEIPMSPYEFFESTSSEDDEVVQQKLRYERERKAAYAQAKQTAKSKMPDRHSMPKAAWSCRDVGFEFADRVLDLWSIKPWKVVQSRFIPALAQMRSRLETNGEIECLMMDHFFKSLEHDKYDSAEVLWKMFLTRAPMLVQQARATVSTVEETMAAKQQADKSWDWVEN